MFLINTLFAHYQNVMCMHVQFSMLFSRRCSMCLAIDGPPHQVREPKTPFVPKGAKPQQMMALFRITNA